MALLLFMAEQYILLNIVTRSSLSIESAEHLDCFHVTVQIIVAGIRCIVFLLSFIFQIYVQGGIAGSDGSSIFSFKNFHVLFSIVATLVYIITFGGFLFLHSLSAFGIISWRFSVHSTVLYLWHCCPSKALRTYYLSLKLTVTPKY